MATKQATRKLTPYEQETIDTLKKVSEYKLSCDANIVASIYKNPDILHNFNLSLNDFTNNIWKVYFQIAYDIIVKEQKTVLDEIVVGIYLEKHSKLSDKFKEYGGYETIIKATEYINVNNVDGYISEQQKWNAVIKLIKAGFPIAHRLSELSDMTADEIYTEFDVKLNHIFINIDDDVKSYSLSYNIHGLIDKLDEGMAIGLPFYDMPMLTKETGGNLIGTISLIGAISNMGKSTFIRNTILTNIIKLNERIVIMLNEEGYEKWQREFLVWVANNIFKEDLQKHIVRDGKYSETVKTLLHKCADWIEEKDKDHTVTLIPFKRYQTSKAIKVIKKYSGMGIKYFVLDTFKADAGNTEDKMWMAMQQAMVDINDAIKPESKNVNITVTFQLGKSSAKQRYYSQDNIGMAKNMIDPASTTLMIRDLLDDERQGGKHELKIFRLEGRNGRSKIPVKLDPDKRYQILFIIKNREGTANQFQIVFEHDMSRNTLKEIGITHVMIDW